MRGCLLGHTHCMLVLLVHREMVQLGEEWRRKWEVVVSLLAFVIDRYGVSGFLLVLEADCARSCRVLAIELGGTRMVLKYVSILKLDTSLKRPFRSARLTLRVHRIEWRHVGRMLLLV